MIKPQPSVIHIVCFQSRDFVSEKKYCPPCWCTIIQWKPCCSYERLLCVKWFPRFVGLSCKMVLCLMVDCSNKSGKVKGVSFHRVPAVVTTKGEFMEELTLVRERRRRWISAISRESLSESILENDRVCGRHFISGKPAQDWDRHNDDWVPTLHLGHRKQGPRDSKAKNE